MNYPVPCFGQQIKDQPESIDFPSGQRKSEVQNKTHTSCCFMVWLVWIYWHKFSQKSLFGGYFSYQDLSPENDGIYRVTQSKANLAVEMGRERENSSIG